MQDQDGALLSREPNEAAFELISVSEGATGIRPRVLAVFEVQGDDRDAAVATADSVALTDDQPVKPGVPCIWLPEGSDAAPSSDQCLLDRVLSTVTIAQDQDSRREQTLCWLVAQAR